MQQVRKSKDPDIWKEGIALVKDVMTSCKTAKQTYVKEKLYSNRKNSKKFWESVKLILPDNNSNSIDTIWDENKNEMVTGRDAAELINYYFATIGEKLAEDVGQTDMVFIPPNHGLNFDWGAEICEPEIVNLLNECCVTKSSGIPEISSKLLIPCLKHMVHFLVRIYNNCLTSGIYPDQWKTSIMVPIPKKTDATLLNNLRPISLLPLPGKVFEKVLHKKIYK